MDHAKHAEYAEASWNAAETLAISQLQQTIYLQNALFHATMAVYRKMVEEVVVNVEVPVPELDSWGHPIDDSYIPIPVDSWGN